MHQPSAHLCFVATAFHFDLGKDFQAAPVSCYHANHLLGGQVLVVVPQDASSFVASQSMIAGGGR
jgi:hypothetical protein